MAFRAPRPLVSGDRVAVIAPASSVAGDGQRARVLAGMSRLREWGLEVVEGAHLWDENPLVELAGTDADRAADLVWAWNDPSIAAIVCARGGYGVQRLLPELAPDSWSAVSPTSPTSPTWLVGFSDVTPLLHQIAVQAGLQSVHGPVVAALSEGDDVGAESLRRLLFGEVTVDPLLTDLTPWRDGQAHGPLVGGNVALLAASAGTGDLVPAQGAVAFLEDVGQPAFVLDRSLTQLLRAGWFDGVHGVLVGDFTMDATAQEVELVLRDRLLSLGVPVWAGGTFGHAPLNRALPHGADVTLGGGALTRVT